MPRGLQGDKSIVVVEPAGILVDGVDQDGVDTDLITDGKRSANGVSQQQPSKASPLLGSTDGKPAE